LLRLFVDLFFGGETGIVFVSNGRRWRVMVLILFRLKDLNRR
jgi:hypothetical protein